MSYIDPDPNENVWWLAILLAAAIWIGASL